MIVSKKYYTGIDLIKLFAAIGIVAIHTNLPFFNVIGRLGVPFFAIVSSFFFFSRWLNATNKKGILNKYLRRIIYLYLLWQLVYIPFMLKAFAKIMQKLGEVDLKNILIYIGYFFLPAITNSKGVNISYNANGWVTSWYLLAVIIGIPFFIFLLKIFNFNLWIIGIISLLLEGYFVLINEFNFINHYSPVLTHTFTRLLVYFYVGYILAKFPQLKKLSNNSILLPILFCLLIIFIAENYFIHYIGGIASNEEVISTLPTSICLVLYAININPSLRNSKSVRDLSTFMYCAQVWPIEILKIVFEQLNIMHLHVLLFVIVLGCILISYGAFRLMITKPSFRIMKYAV